MLGSLTVFEKFIFVKIIHVRFIILLWCMVAALGAYLYFGYLGETSKNWFQTITTKNKTANKETEHESKMKPQYKKLEVIVRDQDKKINTMTFKIYRVDLHMKIYESYRNSGTFEKWYWVTDDLLDSVYEASLKWKKLNPSFDRVYFESFPDDLIKIEKNICNPISPYAVTKFVNELYAHVKERVKGFEPSMELIRDNALEVAKTVPDQSIDFVYY